MEGGKRGDGNWKKEDSKKGTVFFLAELSLYFLVRETVQRVKWTFLEAAGRGRPRLPLLLVSKPRPNQCGRAKS